MGDAPPAGWYQDPHASSQLRYWDGSSWTDHISPVQGPVVHQGNPTGKIIGIIVGLLAVILVIAMLAAIAIPVFLNQRKKGWRAELESTLRNAATAQETYAVGHEGAYTEDLSRLEDEGFAFIPEVEIRVVSSGSDYCIEGRHVSLEGEVLFYDSIEAGITEDSCMDDGGFDDGISEP